MEYDMIHQAKYQNALAAINAVLVTARRMAEEGRPADQLVSILDVAEYLPRLLADSEDKTAEFRDVLVDLTSIDVGFHFALERFDRTDLGKW